MIEDATTELLEDPKDSSSSSSANKAEIKDEPQTKDKELKIDEDEVIDPLETVRILAEGLCHDGIDIDQLDLQIEKDVHAKDLDLSAYIHDFMFEGILYDSY